MNWYYYDFIPLTYLSSIIAFCLAFYSLGKQGIRKTLSFSIMMISVGVWSTASTLELFSANPEIKIFWSKISYIGICLIGPSWLLFSFKFTDINFKNFKYLFYFLYGLSILVMFAAFTNDYHHLIWEKTIAINNEHGMYINYQHGILVKFNSIYTYLLYFTGISLFVYRASHNFNQYGWNTILFAASGLIPVIFNILYLLINNNLFKFDLTPVSFTLTGLLILIGIFKFNLFSVLPIAYKSLFDNISDGVILLNQSLKIKAANPYIFNLAKVENEDYNLIEKVLSDLMKHIDECIKNNLKISEYKCEKENPVKYFELKIEQIEKSGRFENNYLILIHEITKRKSFENELKSSQKTLEKFSDTQGKLLSIISHDFKNSLGGINNAIQFLQMNPEMDESQKKVFLNEILKSSENVYRLLENLLEWGRSKTLKYFHRDIYLLEPIVAEVLELLKLQAFRKDVRFRTDIENNLCINADKEVLSTVLRNLINNGIKYSYYSSEITITARSAKDNIIISVSDKGIGIPANKIKTLFEIDEKSTTLGTLNEKGHGFGLFLCKELIDLHKGKIWAESKQDNGTTFHIELPIQ